MPEIEKLVKAKLGKDTRFSKRERRGRLLGQLQDRRRRYWLMLDRERMRGLTGFQWLGWASVVSLLSLLGAAFISSLINLPLRA
jgi:two-component system osmolarity sensor histidine kinase EnvZ